MIGSLVFFLLTVEMRDVDGRSQFVLVARHYANGADDGTGGVV